VSPDAVLNLTGKMAADGTLTWDGAAGPVGVQRIAMAPDRTQKHADRPDRPAGLEVDKMSRGPTCGAHLDA